METESMKNEELPTVIDWILTRYPEFSADDLEGTAPAFISNMFPEITPCGAGWDALLNLTKTINRDYKPAAVQAFMESWEPYIPFLGYGLQSWDSPKYSTRSNRFPPGIMVNKTPWEGFDADEHMKKFDSLSRFPFRTDDGFIIRRVAKMLSYDDYAKFPVVGEKDSKEYVIMDNGMFASLSVLFTAWQIEAGTRTSKQHLNVLRPLKALAEAYKAEVPEAYEFIEGEFAKIEDGYDVEKLELEDVSIVDGKDNMC